MAVDAAHTGLAAALVAGLGLSIAIECLMQPRPPLVRPAGAWALHSGLWCMAHALLVVLLGRPWFAALAVAAFVLMVVLVNNAKFNTLREPFVFQDYEYFTDAIFHPRLYIPFMGWWKFIGAATGFILAVAIGLWGETAPADRLAWHGQLGAAGLEFALGVVCTLAGHRQRLPVQLDPEGDLRRLGLVASLWRYAEEKQRLPAVRSPFEAVPGAPPGVLPHLVAVQSESFFDARMLHAGIRSEVLAEYDRLKADAKCRGRLRVPAWGANTVRTEFSFLSGIASESLGVHRFNPYRALDAGWQVASLASWLKRQGYRTVCIHPYPSSFYLRNKVYPGLGFDEFIDIRSFAGAERFGPYVADAEVADTIAGIVRGSPGPVFVFAITMENHGPLHLERVDASDAARFYHSQPPPGCDDLTIYLRHLRNADRMIGMLRNVLSQSRQPASLCWFGDHVPIMPAVYEMFGTPPGEVEYAVWNNWHEGAATECELSVESVGRHWLAAAGMWPLPVAPG